MKLRANLANVEEVLAILGYRRDHVEEVGICPEYHWRRGSFHLIVREPHQNILTLTLHWDAHIGYPPFHKPVFIGKAVKEEFDKIVTAYHARMKSNITGQT